MEDLRDYSLYYYSEDHPLKKEKKELKKLYLNLLNHCGCLHLSKNIVNYKLNIFKEKLNYDNEIEELNSDDKILKKLFKKVLKQYFKLTKLKFYTYRYIFIFDCLVLFGEGDKRNTQIFMEKLKKIIDV